MLFQVERSVESWEKFLKLYENVELWISENKTITSEVLVLSDLPQTKQNFQIFNVSSD